MKKLYTITRRGEPLHFGSESKYAWPSPVHPLRYLQGENSVKDLQVKVIDTLLDTVTSINALDFITRYEDPRLKSKNLSQILGGKVWKPYTVEELRRLAKGSTLSEEHSELVSRYLELWS